MTNIWENNIKGGKELFASWFQRFHSMVTLLLCFWACGEAKQHGVTDQSCLHHSSQEGERLGAGHCPWWTHSFQLSSPPKLPSSLNSLFNHEIINGSTHWKSEPSWSNYFPKSVSLNLTTLGTKPSTHEPLGGHFKYKPLYPPK